MAAVKFVKFLKMQRYCINMSLFNDVLNCHKNYVGRRRGPSSQCHSVEDSVWTIV